MNIGKTTRVGIVLASVLAGALGVACGSDETSSSGPPSFDSLAARINAPTGTVSATTATPVADEFEKLSSSSLGGTRQVQASQDMSAQMCTSGGSASVDSSGDASGGSARMSYDACCMAQSCCVSGTVDVVVNTNSTGTSTFAQCVSYDVSMVCDNATATMNSVGCQGTDGTFTYSIEVEGKTYSVSGSYSGGNGTLTIKGANGTFTCTYTSGSGTCTGTDGEFTF